MIPAIAFATPVKLLEAAGDSAHRRAQRANRAAQDVLKDRNRAERDANERLNKRLAVLQNTLKQRLLGDDGAVTDFKRFSVSALAADVDRMIADTTRHLAQDAKPAYDQMVTLGDNAADEPMRAAQLRITPGLPGLDSELVTAAFDNTVDLLSEPMRQFGTDVKVALRQVALAGENKFDAITRLRQQISGQGFDSAQYKAERIVRTELGRSFNQATFNRLLGLAVDFPFLRKGWRAASDSRTRHGHRQAGKTYMRGSGIAIAEMFVIQVYDERKPGQVKLIGVCRLRFPVDPQAEPAGRLAAGATIMCRCNAFVDFDMGDFAQFTAQQIQLALGGVRPPIVPGPQPVPGPVVPKTPPALPKPKRTRVAKPKPAPEPTHKHVLPTGPTEGPLVSKSLVPPKSGPLKALHTQSMGMIDAVHSDGNLRAIPLKTSSGRFYGQFQAYRGSGAEAIKISISAGGLKAHPINTLIHESGHWLDRVALRPALTGSRQGYGPDYISQEKGLPEIDAWRAATKGSPTYQRMTRWYHADPRQNPNMPLYDYEGDGNIPKGITRKHLNYLLSSEETFARSYAQYVTVRSGDTAGMAELRRMQKASTYGAVRPDQGYNYNPMGTEPLPNSWDYPVVWQDDEFKPIAAAFDALFEKVGWRKSSK